MPPPQKRENHHRWIWLLLLLALLMSVICVYSSTYFALSLWPTEIAQAQMLAENEADYGRDSVIVTRFAPVSTQIIIEATQDALGLSITPTAVNSNSSAPGNPVAINTPLQIAQVSATPTSQGQSLPTAVVASATAQATAPTQDKPAATPTPIPTNSPTISPTPTRATATAVATLPPTLTATFLPATATATETPKTIPNTPLPPTQTSVPTATPNPTQTSTPTILPSPTQTAVASPTITNTPTSPATATIPPTATNTPRPTNTPTQTNTPVPTSTNSPTATPTASATPTSVPPTATPTTQPPEVLSIALVDADADTIIPGYETMPDGITLDLNSLPTENLNMWATINPSTVGRVETDLDGIEQRTEFFSPYTFPGNNGFDFSGWNFSEGPHTLTFTPYLEDGTAGIPFVFTFTVVRSSPSSIRPILECVSDNGGGWYTAYFGYLNENSNSVTIPVGANNRFVPAPEHRGQPELFMPGRHTNVITTNFPADENVVWSLDGNTATAGATGPACP